MQELELLTGRSALVTGATSGIGFRTARTLARLGATVYITGRDVTRGQAAEEQIRATAGQPNVRFLKADAATVGGNQLLARQIMCETERLHILVNNVGGAYNDRWETADGFEATLAMDFVGPFALTQALLPLLSTSVPARIVNVASMSHAWFRGDPFTDVQSTGCFLGGDAYSRAKLLNVMWTFELARRLDGSGVVANSADPGGAWTSLTAGLAQRSVPTWMRLFWPVLRWLQRRGSPEVAAQSSIFLASAPGAATLTCAYVNAKLKRAGAAEAALDRRNQQRAYELARKLVAEAPTAAERAPIA